MGSVFGFFLLHAWNITTATTTTTTTIFLLFFLTRRPGSETSSRATNAVTAMWLGSGCSVGHDILCFSDNCENSQEDNCFSDTGVGDGSRKEDNGQSRGQVLKY